MHLVPRIRQVFHFPSKKTLLIFGGGFCLVGFIAFFFYPVLMGSLVSLFLGVGSLPSFWAAHPALYEGVQTTVRFLYGACVVATLDLFVLLYTYKLLDELLIHAETKGIFWRVALRAWWRLLGLQVLAALVICLFLGWWNGFSVYGLIPALTSSSFLNNVWTGAWLISVVCFALGFATEETTAGAVRVGVEKLKYYLLLWGGVWAGILILLWGPITLLASFGLEGTLFVNILLMLWGGLSYFILLTLVLSYLFNKRGLFDSAEAQ